MYLFDTDIFSNLTATKRNYPALDARVVKEPIENVFVSVILLNELLRLALPRIQKEWNSPKMVDAYDALMKLMTTIAQFQMLPFDAAAYNEFTKIPQAIRQAHPNDCRIAAIAISRGLIVVTRNTRHFEKIPGVKFEDWTLETQ